MKIRYYISLILLLTLFVNNSSFAQEKELVEVLVTNEGNYDSNNGTLTQYVVESNTATDGVFATANGGVALGDVVQSIALINDQYYVAANNSGKIIVLNPETFVQEGVIDFGLGTSPREIVQVTDEKAYVTDLWGSKAYIVNLNDFSVSTDTIAMGQNPDKLTFHAGYAYAANRGYGADSTIFKIDPATDLVVDTLFVSRGPTSMVVDSEGVLWVVCTGYSGDYDASWQLIPGTSKPGGIHGIDLETGEEVAFQELSSAGEDIAINEEDKLVYVSSGGVLAYDYENNVIADTVISGSFYAIAYDPVSEQIFTSTAPYTEAGSVSIYNEGGELQTEFSTGLFPGSFYFVYDEVATSIDEELADVTAFSLSQNYPNPFNPTTNIEFNLSESGNVTLAVYTMQGQLVATLAEGLYSHGSHTITFNASSLSSGMYVYRLTSESGSQMKKMLLVK